MIQFGCRSGCRCSSNLRKPHLLQGEWIYIDLDLGINPGIELDFCERGYPADLTYIQIKIQAYEVDLNIDFDLELDLDWRR